MQKAADDMRKQQEQAAEEKAKAIEERVAKLELDGLDQSQLSSQSVYSYIFKLRNSLSYGSQSINQKTHKVKKAWLWTC